MERNALLSLYDRELRMDLEIPGVRRQAFPGLVRYLRPAPGMNQILYSRLAEDALDAEIETQIQELSALDQPFTWKVFDHDQPANLEMRLRHYGFERDDEPDEVLVFDFAEAGEGSFQLNPAVDVRRLTRPEELDQVAFVEGQVLGGDFGWLKERLAAHLETPGYLSIYAAYAEGQPVSVGWTYFHPGSQFVGLFGGATLPEYRRRGIYTAVVSARLQEAYQRGRRFAVTGAGEMSLPILIKRGFQKLTTCWDYIWNMS